MVVAVIAIIIVIIICWMMIRLTVRAELVLASASPWLSSSSLLGQIQPARPSGPLTSRLQRSAQIWEVMIRDRHTHKHCIIIYISSSSSSSPHVRLTIRAELVLGADQVVKKAACG